jgi:hypothetical protein
MFQRWRSNRQFVVAAGNPEARPHAIIRRSLLPAKTGRHDAEW